MGNRNVPSGGISRRSFVGASAAAIAGLAMVGCQPENKLEKAEPQAEGAAFDMELDPAVEGKWVTACCNNNCGGMCLNRVYVVDGVVVRQKTDDTTEDSMAAPQLRACPRGRSKKQHTFGADRLKYPMKRKNWEPHTGGKKELRGQDEWVRISWDEAFEIIADELRNTIDLHGNRAILLPGQCKGNVANVINSIGGCVTSITSGSMGTAVYHSTVMGMPVMGLGEENDRTDWVNADYIVLYGCNQAWASPGTYMYYFNEAKKAGVQFVFVGPEYNATAAHFNAKWIQVRPGADLAFLLAVAYQMFVNDEQEPGSVIDWDFLAKYTVGIDGDSMPSDAKVDENFRDYVMGIYDGQPKTPEWASTICGTPVEDIAFYADMLRKDNAVTTLRSYAAFRTNDSDDTNYLWMTVSLMGGHLGKPGNSTGTAYHNCVGSCIDDIFRPGVSGAPAAPANPVTDVVNDPEQWSAILNGTFNCRGSVLECPPENRKDIDTHLVVFTEASPMNTLLDTASAIDAVRKVDFVFATARAYTTQAQYADVVLPVITEWEKVGDLRGGSVMTLKNREALIGATRVCEPLFEAKSDKEIAKGLAQKLELDADELFPLSDEQEFFNILAGTTMKSPDTGEFVPFLTITEDDVASWGVEGKPQEGVISLAEFLEKGIYKVERRPGDAYTYYGYQDFIADPEANPRATPSGKFEIYSQTKADALNAAGYTTGGFVWKPYPTYKAPVNGYEAAFADFENGVRGDYPYQVFNPHYLRRSHTQFDNLPYLRQAFSNPVFISSADAAEKGIEDGDTVRIYNERSQSLRPASVTERLMPGVVALPHGPWVDMDKDGVDHAGAENLFTAPVTSGMGVAGYNTNLINFEKYEGASLEEDYLLAQRIPAIEE